MLYSENTMNRSYWRLSFFLFLLLILGGFTTVAFAHVVGVSYEDNKAGYKIDIGYDQLINQGTPARFDFALTLLDPNATTTELFTDVWVTFLKNKTLYFAGDIHKPVYGSTGFTYVFPEPGTYTVSARYQKQDDSIVEDSFTVDVLPAPIASATQSASLLTYILIGGAGLFIGISVGLFIPRSKHTSS